MANALFDPGREGFLIGEIDWDTAVIKVALVRGYTFNAANKFVSDVTGAGGTLVSTSAAFASKTFTNGVADAADLVPTFTSVAAGAACTSLILFQSSAVTGGADVAATAQRLIAFIDGKFRVEIAATASGGATSITPEDLPAPIPSGGTLSLISGTGPATVTTSAVGNLGDRTLAVTALGSGITAGAVYEYTATGAGLPITPDGNNINITWDNGANKMFKL
jgi:hypothetical protein